MSTEFETLDQTGFKIEDTSINYEKTLLSAEFGSGYQATAIIGLPVREWTVQIDVLPDLEQHQLTTERGFETRANYLWDFYCRQMDAGSRPFWIRDKKDTREYLVKFADRKLTYKVFTTKLFSSGFQLVQTRVKGVSSPGAPIDAENPDSI
jgi:hypothetical protein